MQHKLMLLSNYEAGSEKESETESIKKVFDRSASTMNRHDKQTILGLFIDLDRQSGGKDTSSILKMLRKHCLLDYDAFDTLL